MVWCDCTVVHVCDCTVFAADNALNEASLSACTAQEIRSHLPTQASSAL